ncbi:P60-like protein [Meira miltonrushii]|uniref:Ribosome biogenesis protein NOP53 n=1 Tax=Meira miltonrushii TaxID=1280837 RepID=A0A316V9B6_9BASI|nr:P60-like protein [Meira miltonrushii]PWN33061.1 P60-like protein [Meira miltonrushii]
MPKAKQPSRKTKSTWRKNIDITGVEASLENQRAAERLGLAPITSNTHASSLFVEDRVGDDSLKKKAGKKPLKSLAILREKDEGSAPVIGRARRGVMDALTKPKGGKQSSQSGLTPEQRALKSGMSRKDLEKLRRTAGRNVKGAFGVIVDEDDEEGVRQRGPTALVGEENYDVWSSAPEAQSSASTLEEAKKRNKPSKAPGTLLEVRTKDVALPLPNQGQSYNPAAEAHEALLSKALQKAQAEEEAKRQELEYKQKWDEAAKAQALTAKDGVERLIGMQVNAAEDEEESSDEEDDDETAPTKKLAKRKTKQQRAKAKKLKEEIRAREQVKASKRTRVQLQQLRALRQELLKVDEEHQMNIAKRKEARQRRADEKVGMFKLQKPEEEVQLGEDLAESLRGLKPEGNLLRDRIHAFQKRGLIEPKKQNVMKNNLKGLNRRQKEYELHSYKRFK